MKRKFFLKRFAVYFFAFFIPTFLLFVIAMVVFGRNAEQRLISQEQKVLESTDTNLSLVVNNIAMQNDLFTKKIGLYFLWGYYLPAEYESHASKCTRSV